MAISRNVSARRREVRRSVPRPGRLPAGLDRSQFAWITLWVMILTIFGGLMVVSGQSQPNYREGEVLAQPLIARVDFEAPDPGGTNTAKALAREAVPSIYNLNEEYFKELRARFDSLVRLASASGAISAEVSPQAIIELRKYVDEEGNPTPQWHAMVEQFLHDRPGDLSKGLAGLVVMRPERIQEERRNNHDEIMVRHKGHEQLLPASRWVDVSNTQDLEQRVRNLAAAADFPTALHDAVVELVAGNPKRTYHYDEPETQLRRARAVENVPQLTTPYLAGNPVIESGTKLTPQHLELIQLEQDAYLASIGTQDLIALRTGQFGFVALLAVGLWAYIVAFNHRVVRNPMRGFAIVVLLLICQAVAVGATQFNPALLYFTATFPTLLAAIVLAIAYDQRFALAVGAMHVLLVMFSLQLSAGYALMLLVGVGVALSQLDEVRTRSKLVQVGAYAGGAMALASFVTSLAERPMQLEGELSRILIDATIALGTGVVVGMFVQSVLPMIERVFKVTTSMTLRELNDASHPLLQRLAQAAPGTYQHSLRLADITEAAAEAIGANGLMCRVGAMYHDIGKMNKPLYFIENQAGGPNRHNKLSPAMSVLIIVGHVKDGIEMAREYGLPPVLRHFIESHHGTTLVEYFYNAARQQREAEDQPAPTEFEFRYPGPKPQTREAAILMLGDGVESACRTLSDPTPARLEALVHKMAQKRLMDGQFDECHLTLAELHRIEAAITKTLNAVYHGRIAYTPADERRGVAPAEPPAPAAPPAADDQQQPESPRTASAG